MKLHSFMLLGLISYVHIYLFCLQKAYAGNACLVNSKSTLLKLSTEFIPISREALLKVAFAFASKSFQWTWTFEVLYWYFSHLRPWEVCLSRQATPQVILLGNRKGCSHRICYHFHQGCHDIWLLYILLFLEASQVAFPGRWLGSLMGFASSLSSWQSSYWMIFAPKCVLLSLPLQEVMLLYPMLK